MNFSHKRHKLINWYSFSICMYRVFIKYCVFSKILKDIPDSGLYRFPLVVSVCTQWQVKPQCLQQNLQSSGKSHILRKNTIFNAHPVPTNTEHLLTDIFLFLIHDLIFFLTFQILTIPSEIKMKHQMQALRAGTYSIDVQLISKSCLPCLPLDKETNIEITKFYIM